MRHFDQRDLHGVAQEERGAALLRLLEVMAQAGCQEEPLVELGELLALFNYGRRLEGSPTKSRCTVMRFWVSVPVLSVQMTVVEPSVSTEGR